MESQAPGIYEVGHVEYSGNLYMSDDSPGRKLPFLTELHLSRKQTTVKKKKKSSIFTNSTVASEFPPLSSNDGGRGEEEDDAPRVIMSGLLSKTTISGRYGSKPGPTRQRNFRLTEQALEYLNTFSQVKVKRSFPLTSIEKVEYNVSFEPTIFRLIFSDFIEILQAETAEDANDWVVKISEACAKWHPSSLQEPSFEQSSQQDSDDEASDLEVVSESGDKLERAELENEQRSKRAESDSKADIGCEHLLAKHHFTSNVSRGHQRRFTAPLLSFRRRIRDKKRLGDKQNRKKKGASKEVDFDKSFLMIKYPRNNMLGTPNNRLLKLDPYHMQILWRRNQRSRFQITRSLSLHKVVEVREGQNTDMFDKFPYPKAEKQSFSLVYQQEDKRYAYLTSLDIICSHSREYGVWINELKSIVRGQENSSTHPRLSIEDDDRTDTTLLWLKQIWSCKSENGELHERTAIKLAKKLNPFITEQYAKRIVAYAHHHQVDSSHGLSLDFSGFVLMFNLLQEITDNRLHLIFKEYAKTSPQLGMTLKEFREFLVNECCWQRGVCTKAMLRKLVHSHESYHQAYKKYCAKNKSSDFVAGYKLLSFVGFLSFLRSKDNSAIDPEHETVYQDMTQPLSHYFINSSHNTYLEGDQLKGKSSTDAYVRAFIQGCRCVEIDCWDDKLNVTKLEEREPIIYHGYTLTTKLPFREVIHTIKEYGFTYSKYPVVISIENHCNKEHQTRMAKIFRAIFDEMLPKEDLVELEGRTRLPSPKELQGKIILKGSYKEEEKVDKKPTRFRQMLMKVTSLSSASSPTDSITISPLHSLLSLKQNTLDIKTSALKEESKDEETSSVGSDGAGSVFSLQETDAVDGDVESLDSDNDDEYLNKKRFSRQKSKSLKEICRLVVETEQGQDDQELEFKDTLGDLRSLIIYAKALSIKPWSWERQRATKVTQMFSFGEPTAVELSTKWISNMLACTERQLVRTYPKGTRFDSSNYDPMIMWRCGIQMVALNFQYPDIYMHLNQGFFRQNGGCGYVLKPAVMRREDPHEGSTAFDPEMQTPHPDVPPVEFEIELISGQRLCPWKKRRSSVTVKIRTYGINHDHGCTHIPCGITHDCTHIIEAVHDNALWPHWKKEKHHLKKTIYMPELCLVYFRVETDRKVFGQNCIPIISLQPGIKFIPLRTPGGELIPGSGLFVKIKKAAAVTTDEIPSEGGEVESPPLHMSRISRQDTIDFEDGDIDDTMNDIKEEEVEEESEADSGDEDGMAAQLKSDMPRRFSSPASFDGTGSYFNPAFESVDLTTIAEVYEDIPNI